MARSCFYLRACLPRPRHLFPLLMLFALGGTPAKSSESVPAERVLPPRIAVIEELLVRPLKPPAKITCEKRRYFYNYC